MPAGQTTITTTLGGVSKSISGGQDASSNFVPGHALFDVNGSPISTLPVSIAGTVAVSNATENTSLSSIITQTTASASGIGSTADTAYAGSGSSSLVAALKGIYARLVGTLSTTHPPTTLVSRSVTTVAATSTSLVASNASRRILRVQAPQSTGIWLNLLGGTCAPNAVNCFFLSQGGVFESSDSNAVTYYCATASLVIAAVEG